MTDDYVAILDIGTTKIVAMVGKQDANGKLKILGYGEDNSAGVNRGLVLNVNESSAVIAKVVQQAREQSDIDFKEVYVGIAGQHISSTQISHSIINQKADIIQQELVDKIIEEVYNMSLNPGEKILHVFPQEYRVDNTSVINPVGTMGRQLQGRFHISVGKDSKIEILSKSVEMAGLKIKHLVLEPVASAQAVLSAEEKEAGVALIDIGGGTTDLIIYKDNLIRYTAVIPFGGNSITNDIQKGCGILTSQAEKLKIEYGSAIADLVKESDFAPVEGIGGRENREISFKTIAKIIQARSVEIIDTVAYELKKSGFDNLIAAGITVTGGGSLLKNLKQFIEFRTGFETNLAKPDDYIFTSPGAFSHPKYSTSIGLLLKGNEIEQKLIAKKQAAALEKQKQLQKQEEELAKTVVLEQENQNKNDDSKNDDKTKKKKRNFFSNLTNGLKEFFVEEDDSTEV